MKLVVTIILLALLSSCGKNAVDLPEPNELFAYIQSEIELPNMVNVVNDFLEDNIGIEPDEYESAVYYILGVGLSPDEIIIVKAKDNAAAAVIKEKLEARLAYKAKSAEKYLTEYLPMINKGIVRRDGLTVSLIVSEYSEGINNIYRNWE